MAASNANSNNNLLSPNAALEQVVGQRRKSSLANHGFFIDYSSTRRRSSAAAQAREQQQHQSALASNQFLRTYVSPVRWPRGESFCAGQTSRYNHLAANSSQPSSPSRVQSRQSSRTSGHSPGNLGCDVGPQHHSAPMPSGALLVPALHAPAALAGSRKTSIFDPAGHSIAPQLMARRKSAMVSGGMGSGRYLPAGVMAEPSSMLTVARSVAAAKNGQPKRKGELAQHVPVIGCSPTSIRASLAALEETRRYEKLLRRLQHHQRRREKRHRRQEKLRAKRLASGGVGEIGTATGMGIRIGLGNDNDDDDADADADISNENENNNGQDKDEEMAAIAAAVSGLRRKSVRAIREAATLINRAASGASAASRQGAGQYAINLDAMSISTMSFASSSRSSLPSLDRYVSCERANNVGTNANMDTIDDLFEDEDTMVNLSEQVAAAETVSKSGKSSRRKSLVRSAMKRLAATIANRVTVVKQQQQQQRQQRHFQPAPRRAASMSSGGMSYWYYYYYLREHSNCTDNIDDLPIETASVSSESERRARLHINYSLARIEILNCNPNSRPKFETELALTDESGQVSAGSNLFDFNTSTDMSLNLSSSSTTSSSTSRNSSLFSSLVSMSESSSQRDSSSQAGSNQVRPANTVLPRQRKLSSSPKSHLSDDSDSDNCCTTRTSNTTSTTATTTTRITPMGSPSLRARPRSGGSQQEKQEKQNRAQLRLRSDSDGTGSEANKRLTVSVSTMSSQHRQRSHNSLVATSARKSSIISGGKRSASFVANSIHGSGSSSTHSNYISQTNSIEISDDQVRHQQQQQQQQGEDGAEEEELDDFERFNRCHRGYKGPLASTQLEVTDKQSQRAFELPLGYQSRHSSFRHSVRSARSSCSSRRESCRSSRTSASWDRLVDGGGSDFCAVDQTKLKKGSLGSAAAESSMVSPAVCRSGSGGGSSLLNSSSVGTTITSTAQTSVPVRSQAGKNCSLLRRCGSSKLQHHQHQHLQQSHKGNSSAATRPSGQSASYHIEPMGETAASSSSGKNDNDQDNHKVEPRNQPNLGPPVCTNHLAKQQQQQHQRTDGGSGETHYCQYCDFHLKGCEGQLATTARSSSSSSREAFNPLACGGNFDATAAAGSQDRTRARSQANIVSLELGDRSALFASSQVAPNSASARPAWRPTGGEHEAHLPNRRHLPGSRRGTSASLRVPKSRKNESASERAVGSQLDLERRTTKRNSQGPFDAGNLAPSNQQQWHCHSPSHSYGQQQQQAEGWPQANVAEELSRNGGKGAYGRDTIEHVASSSSDANQQKQRQQEQEQEVDEQEIRSRAHSTDTGSRVEQAARTAASYARDARCLSAQSRSSGQNFRFSDELAPITTSRGLSNQNLTNFDAAPEARPVSATPAAATNVKHQSNKGPTEEFPAERQRRQHFQLLGKKSFTCMLIGARQCGKRTIVKCFVKLLNEFKLAVGEYKREKLLAQLIDCSERLQDLASQREDYDELERRNSMAPQNQRSRLNSWLGTGTMHKLLHLPGKRRLTSALNLLGESSSFEKQTDTIGKQLRRHTAIEPPSYRQNETSGSQIISVHPMIGMKRESLNPQNLQQYLSSSSSKNSCSPIRTTPEDNFLRVETTQGLNKSDFDISYHDVNGNDPDQRVESIALHQIQLPVPSFPSITQTRPLIHSPHRSPSVHSTNQMNNLQQTHSPTNTSYNGPPETSPRLSTRNLSLRSSKKRKPNLSLKELNKRRIRIKFKTRRQLSERYFDEHSNSDEDCGANFCQPHSEFPDSFMIVYSINDRESFDYAKTLVSLIKSVKQNAPLPVILVANKIDLERAKVVKSEEGRALARRNGCKFMEISCTVGFNLDNLLVGLRTQLILRHHTCLNSILRPNGAPKDSKQQQQQQQNQTKAESGEHEIGIKQIGRPNERHSVDKTSVKGTGNIIVRFYKRYLMYNEQNNDCDNFSKL